MHTIINQFMSCTFRVFRPDGLLPTDRPSVLLLVGLPPSDCYATVRETRIHVVPASNTSLQISPIEVRCFRWTLMLSNESNHEFAYTRHPPAVADSVLCASNNMDPTESYAPTHSQATSLSSSRQHCEFSASLSLPSSLSNEQ